MTRPDGEGEVWYEGEAGPMVRPYTVTRGRTRPAAEHAFDLTAWVSAADGGPEAERAGPRLDHARASLLALIRRGPRALAELAAAADLPLTVVRVVLGDLVDAGLVHIGDPPPATGRPDPALLREVLERLHDL
ncbi:DUF742 domain-containing protein [Streptomyces sp. NPDC048639]|uniref:DUF742 domain-containing protein n=1 Tax=Streptomyces sp. NPDC048639 TaxID=3365581 RepID=UPI00371B0D08